MASVAVPLLTAEVPSVVEPLVNVTVPVTLFGSLSVKVTELPGKDGLTEDVSVDVGLAFATVWVVVPTAEV